MANRTRPKQIVIRLSEEEYQKVKSQVLKSGMKQQEYLIKAITDQPISNMDGLKAVVPEMKKAGTNLNQITRKINSGEVPSNETFLQLKKEYEEVWQLLKQLIQEQA